MPPPKRILCVDDDEDTCGALTHLLKYQNYEAFSVIGIEEALELTAKESFDLYILDTWLKTGSGNRLCTKLRARFPDALIIVYSAAAHEQEKQEAIRAGANAFRAKPYIEELLEVVRRLLT
jgi:DNA-binding response OmpR family regulator